MEPDLYFRDGKKCIDPKVGLVNFGPSGLKNFDYEIEIGIIGTKESIFKTKKFLNRLQYTIPGDFTKDSNIRSIDFPGVNEGGHLGFYFTVRDEFIETLPEDLEKKIKAASKIYQKIIMVGEAYEQALKDLAALHPKPKLVIVSISKKILEECTNPYLKDQKIKLMNRTISDLKKVIRYPPLERPPFFDFHHFIKVIGYELNLHTQIIKPNTLEFQSLQGHDPATIAWNFSVASYYKSTGIPWKLADLEPETVHIGVSFYYDINYYEEIVIRAAIAQVYMRTGDSQVVRGIELNVDEEEEEDRTPMLSEKEAMDIMNQALSLYKRKHNNEPPQRVVVHKTSPYNVDELRGLTKSAEDVPIKDFLHISPNSEFRVITPTKYPIARGSVFPFTANKKKGFYIFTTGFVPAFSTYMGHSVPKPIKVIVESNESSFETLATDIMNLTKLDWNSSDFSKRLPATIAVSKKIGEIMGELKGRNIPPPTAYSYYM